MLLKKCNFLPIRFSFFLKFSREKVPGLDGVFWVCSQNIHFKAYNQRTDHDLHFSWCYLRHL